MTDEPLKEKPVVPKVECPNCLGVGTICVFNNLLGEVVSTLCNRCGGSGLVPE